MFATASAAPAPVLQEDETFVERLAALDADAWNSLFNARFTQVYAFAYARTGDMHLAEDIASEVFSEAARGIGKFRYQGIPVSHWLLRIARNVTSDFLTERKKRGTRFISLEANEWAEGQATESLPDVAAWTDLRRAVAGLKREHQEVLILRFVHGLSLAGVAQATGKSVGAVKLLQHRATVILRKRLSAERTSS